MTVKIGEFAVRCGVGIDTVRHYVSLDLLQPQKAGKQFDFDERCRLDFDEILRLKSLGFSLAEIRDVFLTRRLGRMTDYRQSEYYRGIFERKRSDTASEIERLHAQLSGIAQELRRLDTPPPPARRAGVGIGCLPLLRCAACGGTLSLSGTAVEDDRIAEGVLRCRCGQEYPIRGGILYAGEGDVAEEAPPDVVSYIRQTDDEYLRQVYRMLEWSHAHIDFGAFENRVILEPGSGSGFFLRRMYDDLPESAVYIAVDRDPERMRFLKETLEKAEKRRNILYLCGDFAQLPLAPGCVDIICDYTGSSNYGFEHPDFLLTSLNRFLRPKARLCASFLIFEKFVPGSAVPPACRGGFQSEVIRHRIAQLGFSVTDETRGGAITKGGVFESFFQQGETVSTYGCIAERSG